MRQTKRSTGSRVCFCLLIFSAIVLLGLTATFGGLQGLVGNDTFKPLVRVEKSSDSHVVLVFLGRRMKGPHIPGVSARIEDAAETKVPGWKRWITDVRAEIRGWGREVSRLFDEWRLDGSFSLQEKPIHR